MYQNYNNVPLPYGGGRLGYSMQSQRITKSQVVQMMREYILANTGCVVSKEERIEELPKFVRHACMSCGVSYLPACDFSIPLIGLSTSIYFCKGCGKLYYLKDFM